MPETISVPCKNNILNIASSNSKMFKIIDQIFWKSGKKMIEKMILMMVMILIRKLLNGIKRTAIMIHIMVILTITMILFRKTVIEIMTTAMQC